MSVKVEAAVAAAREALELARGLGARWHEYDAARLLAIGLSQAQRAAEAADLLEPYRGLVAREGDREKRYQYWSDMAYVLQGANRRQQCVQALSRAIRFAEEMGDLAQARTCTCNLAGALSDLGRVDEALTQADRALRLRERLGDTQSALSGALDSQVGLLYTAVGRYREALQHFDAALECFRGADHATWRTIVQNHKADTLLVLGQPGRALKAIDQTDETVLTTTRARSLIVGARIERALGRPGTPKLRQAVELLGERGDPYMRVLAELDATREQSGPGAVDQCTTLLARAERLERLGVAIKARFLRADCLLRAGEAGRSRDEIYAALSMLEKTQPWDMYLPEVWWIAYQVFDANDDKPAAVGALRLAITWINDAALPQVPDEYCDSFLHRNPVNRALLTTASRRLGL
jgi:tetratricopeptide (TPR) repeat protein